MDRHPGYEEPRRRSPLREPNHQELTSAHTDHMRSHRSKHSDHAVAGLPHSKYSDHPVAGLPHSKYLDREALASYDTLPAKDYSSYITQRSSSSVNNGYHHSVDVTDPQAVRDTHIHFLNDNINNPSKPWGTSARLTHVGVHVPGSSGMPHHAIPGSMSHHAMDGSSTMPPHAMPHHAMPPRRSATNGHALTSNDIAVTGATNTTYTVPCVDSSGLGKKLRKNLKSGDRDTGTYYWLSSFSPFRLYTSKCAGLNHDISMFSVIWFLAISSLTRSRHLSFGLPRFHFPSTVICNIFLVASSLSRLCTWPNHLDLFSLMCLLPNVSISHMIKIVFPLAHPNMRISCVCLLAVIYFCWSITRSITHY